MSKVQIGRLHGEPTMESIQSQIDQLTTVINGKIDFGDPLNPFDPTSTALAGTTHNGTHGNISGSWVEVVLTGLPNNSKKCTHNLYLNDPDYIQPVAGQPNCRWLVMGVQHDGFGLVGAANANVDVSFVNYTTGLANVNDITLNFRVDAVFISLPVSATHPIRVSLFFTKATLGE